LYAQKVYRGFESRPLRITDCPRVATRAVVFYD
jgi:hypothetical protein